MTSVNSYALMLVAAVVSFIGFCVENTFVCLSSGVIDNRNMVLPFLFGYGLIILAFYKLFGTPNHPVLLGKELNLSDEKGIAYCFIIAFIGVCVGEIIVGHLTEWLLDIVWWDYSEVPLHITRYTSIPTSFAFAAMITIFMKYCFTPLLNYFSRMNPHALSFLAIAITLVLTFDMINSAIYMFKHGEILRIWKIEFKRSLKELIFDFAS